MNTTNILLLSTRSMIRPYKDYVASVIGKRVDYDGSFGYQCVDLAKDYCSKVLGMKLGKTWDAKDRWTNKYNIFNKTRTRIKGMDDLMQWDIIIRWRWKYGHIAIFDHWLDKKVFVLEQNGSWKDSWSWLWDNAIRVQGYWVDFFDWVWRCPKIIANWKQEMAYIKNKIDTKGIDEVTKEYAESTLKKVK